MNYKGTYIFHLFLVRSSEKDILDGPIAKRHDIDECAQIPKVINIIKQEITDENTRGEEVNFQGLQTHLSVLAYML